MQQQQNVQRSIRVANHVSLTRAHTTAQGNNKQKKTKKIEGKKKKKDGIKNDSVESFVSTCTLFRQALFNLSRASPPPPPLLKVIGGKLHPWVRGRKTPSEVSFWTEGIRSKHVSAEGWVGYD